MTPFARLGWALVPGPTNLDGIGNSQDSHDLTMIPPERVIDALLAIPGVECIHPAEPDWWSWRALYVGERDGCEIDCTLFVEPPAWGGSELDGIEDPRTLLDIWRALDIPGVYAHNGDCELFSQQAFVERYLG